MRSDSEREGERERVVVTGLGAITAAGAGVETLAARLARSDTCIREIRHLDTTGLRVHVGGEVDLPEEIPLLPREGRVRASRSDRLALVAVDEALRSAGLGRPGLGAALAGTPGRSSAGLAGASGRFTDALASTPGRFTDALAVTPERLGVAIGSSTGGMRETEQYVAARVQDRPTGVLASRLLGASVAAPADIVAAALGALGPRLAPSTACSSSAIAIAMGALWIRSGKADVVVAGGSDSLTLMTLTGFHSLQALSPEPCRPFDVERRGLTIGEGAGVLVLESARHARARGAATLGEIAGAGMSCDAHHLTAPHPEAAGAVLALRQALADAGLTPGAIQYVNAHGTGTPQNDVAENAALCQVLGEAVPRVPVSSIKGLIGHLLGAAGAVEAIATLLAMRDGLAPPTAGLREPDPAFAIDLVRGEARAARIDVAVSNSYGFGGNNCSLVFRSATVLA